MLVELTKQPGRIWTNSSEFPLTAFLASVRDAREARVALDAGADIIDAKEPDAGALGAVSIETLGRIVGEVAGARPVSATIGDLPMQPELIASAVRERAGQGADYVKFGLFGSERSLECASAACAVAGRAKIIVVLFADLAVTQSFISAESMTCLGRTGVSGLMLDTADKSGGGLLKHFDAPALGEVVRRAAAANLLCGLAGALKIHDIIGLMGLRPDFLGFRGALCASGVRGDVLSGDRAHEVANLIKKGATAKAVERTLTF